MESTKSLLKRLMESNVPEKGIESLKQAVLRDTNSKWEKGCFNENGCDKEVSCGHKYCNKYKWIVDRAKVYADATGKSVEEVIAIWEKQRTYWYMNYYQDSNQPLLTNQSIIFYDDWVAKGIELFGDNRKEWRFKCPVCGNIQSANDFIHFGIEEPESKIYFSCIGRWVKGTGCDYTLGGLLKANMHYVIKDCLCTPVFEFADGK
jgi:hypothetical protein